MRKTLGKIHTWLGLLCAPYILILGLSTLNFSHHFGFMNSGEYTLNWERDISGVADTSDDAELATRIRDAMDLRGGLPWWRYNRQDDNTFVFTVGQRGRDYRITVNQQRTHASVAENHHSVFRVIASLHTPGATPGMPLTKVWRLYALITIAFVLYAGGSGLYFWTRRKDEKLIGKILLICFAGGSLLFMIFIRIWG